MTKEKLITRVSEAFNTRAEYSEEKYIDRKAYQEEYEFDNER